MSRKKGFSRLTKFLQPPKLVAGIFEVSLRLQKFWWVQEIVRTRNGFVLIDFFAIETKFQRRMITFQRTSGSTNNSIPRKAKFNIVGQIMPRHDRLISLDLNVLRSKACHNFNNIQVVTKCEHCPVLE